MASLATVLPFLKNMLQPAPPDNGSVPDGGNVVDMTAAANTPSKLPNKAAMPAFLASLAKGPMGPEAPPEQPPDAGNVPPPPLNLGQGQVQPPLPGTATGDPTQDMPAIQGLAQPESAGAPQPDKGSMFREPGETKGHALLRILMSGARGGLAGVEQNAETYAQTGRNGGFGGGAYGAAVLPWEIAAKRAGVADTQSQVALRNAQAKMMGTSIPITLPNGQTVYVPASQSGKPVSSVISGQYGNEKQEIQNKGNLDVAQTNKRFIPVPGVGLFDSQSRTVLPGTENGITITPEIAADHDLPQEFIGKPMSLQQLSAVQRSDVFQNTPVMTAQGPVVVNRKTATAKPVTGPGGQTYSPPALANPKEVGDQDNPGQTKIVSGGTAIATGAAGPQSASVQVPRKAMGSEVPTNIGNKKVAFSTMISHAELLRQVAKAVNNGDWRTYNSLKNKVTTEFGDGDYTNLQAIANAYNHEVTTVISKGHMTDSEVGAGARTLPIDANYSTINKVLNTYEALAQSKMDNLNKQKQNAVRQSQSNSSGNKKDPLGIL